MKRLSAILLIASLTISCVACGTGNKNNTQSNPNTQQNSQAGSENNSVEESELQLQITDANEILTTVWDSYPEDEKFFAVGGHYENYTDGGPATYDISKVEDLENSFCIPQEAIAMIDDVATLQHAMNVNNFSAAAYHLKSNADMQTLIDSITNMTLNNQWLCGFPEKLVIISVGDEYIVTAFGNREIVDNFKNRLLGLYNQIPDLLEEEDL